MVDILVFVASQIGHKNFMNRHVRTLLKQLIAEEGGNPQLLRFQLFLMGQLGKGLTDYSDNIQPSVTNTIPDTNTVFREPDRPVALPTRTTQDTNYQGFLEFMDSQSPELITALRACLKLTLIKSHILSSVENLQAYPPLRRLLLGYSLSGDKAIRGTPLMNDWDIGKAEQAGYIYLDPAKPEVGTKRHSETEFHVVVPLLLYEYFVAAVQPGDLLDIDVLRGNWHDLSSRDVEKLDISALAFAFAWYFEKAESFKASLNDLTKCKLKDIFPRIEGLPDITLNKPKNFRKVSIRFTADKSFTTVASDFTNVATFTLGCGNDAFPDSWGHFQKANEAPFTIFIQSKKTTTGRKFTQDDLAQQLEYLQGLTQDWIIFIITDGEFAHVKVQAQYAHRVFMFDHSSQHLFYGPVLAMMRKTLIQWTCLHYPDS